MAMGGIKVKSETRRFVQERCHCIGEDEKCPDCGGTGWVTLTDKSIVQETISELAPSLQLSRFFCIIMTLTGKMWSGNKRTMRITKLILMNLNG